MVFVSACSQFVGFGMKPSRKQAPFLCLHSMASWSCSFLQHCCHEMPSLGGTRHWPEHIGPIFKAMWFHKEVWEISLTSLMWRICFVWRWCIQQQCGLQRYLLWSILLNFWELPSWSNTTHGGTLKMSGSKRGIGCSLCQMWIHGTFSSKMSIYWENSWEKQMVKSCEKPNTVFPAWFKHFVMMLRTGSN